MGKLHGGSQGEPEKFSSHPFFYPEVKAVEFLVKNNYGGRILPAFPRDDAGQITDRRGFIPYRDQHGKLDKVTGYPAFSDFYFLLQGYKFVGNDGAGFLSPLNLAPPGPRRRGVDPLLDIALTASNHTNKAWNALVEKAEGEKNAVLPFPKQFVLMNWLAQVEEGKYENRICVGSGAALTGLKELLNKLRPAIEKKIIDPDFPDFLYGDVTSPVNGLWATVQKTVFNQAGMSTSMFSFSRDPDRLVSEYKFPIDPNDAWGQGVLEGRYDISDTDKVTRIWTAEDILNYIVQDGFLPYELIVEACSSHWNIPAENKRKTHSTPPPDNGEDEVPGLRRPAQTATAPAGSPPPGPAAAAPAATAPRTAPAATPPTVSNRMFWYAINGQTNEAPEAIVRNLVLQFGDTLPVMEKGQEAGGWKTAADYGIRKPAPAPAPSAPPAPPAGGPPPPPSGGPPKPPGAPAGGPPKPPGAPAGGPPKPPGAPAGGPPAGPRPGGPPPAPSVAATPPPAPLASASQTSSPTATGGLTEVEQGELDALQQKFINDPHSLNVDEMNRYTDLSTRASGSQ